MRAAREISSWGTILTGSNCTVGPQRMVEITGQMADAAGPVAAFPNPSLPQLVDGHIRFRRHTNHFAQYGVKLAEAGARLVGGCCGTTPAHVKALSEALRDFEVGPARVRRPVAVLEGVERREVSAEPVSEFAERLRTGFAVHHRDQRRSRQLGEHFRVPRPWKPGELECFFIDGSRRDRVDAAAPGVGYGPMNRIVHGPASLRRQVARRKRLSCAINPRLAHRAHTRIARRLFGDFGPDACRITSGNSD